MASRKTPTPETARSKFLQEARRRYHGAPIADHEVLRLHARAEEATRRAKEAMDDPDATDAYCGAVFAVEEACWEDLSIATYCHLEGALTPYEVEGLAKGYPPIVRNLIDRFITHETERAVAATR